MADSRVPVTDPCRRLLRKAKLWLRETTWVAHNSPDGLMLCPCSICERGNRKRFSIAECARMIEAYGRHEACWGSSEGFEVDESDDEWDAHVAETCGTLRAPRDDSYREYHEMESLIMDAFNYHEQFQGSFPAEEARREFCEAEEGVDWGNVDDMHAISAEYVAAMHSARTPLFHDSNLQQLNGLVMLLSIFESFGAPDALTSQVLAFLSVKMLPQPNTLPSSTYEATKLLSKLGLGYRSIHACPNGCVLYRGRRMNDLKQCPKCQAPRFRRYGKSEVPAKVIRYFPIVPRLKRMFANENQAQLMTWHGRNLSRSGKVRMAADSYQWKWINWR